MTGNRLEIDLLGPLQVRVDGEPVAVPGPRRRAVLAMLAVTAPDTLSADGLVDAVWGDESTDAARNSLQSQISRLRGHLGPCADRLVRRDGGYRLLLEPGERDVDRVRSELADARSLASTDPSGAADLLGRLLEVWRGAPLEEFAEVAPLAAEAVALGDLRAAVMDERAELLLAAGRLDDAVEQATRAATEAPLRERSQLLLMRALASAGRAPDALRHGSAFRRRMAEETGLDPSPAVGEVEHAIASGELTVGRSGRSVAPEPGPTVDLPGRALALLGRSDEQAQLEQLLATERLVTLLGPGGVGKTRLATELAWHDPRTVGFAALAELDDPAALVPALATSLGLRTAAGEAMREACVARLAGTDALLVVDNCEHVLVEARELVAELIARCPRLVVLTTSREPLDLPEEHLFRLGPLPVPPPDASLAGSWPSVELFAAHAQRVSPGFRIDDASWDAIAEVCRELDGLPLALELAAGRVATLGLDGLRSRMERMLDVVVGGRARGPGTERHADLVSLVRWSYDLLGPEEARLFRHLSAFVGGFDLGMAEHVAGGLGVASPVSAVARLAEASLLTVEGDPPRFSMLNTIRAFGESELTRHRETDAAAALLVHWATDLALEVKWAFYGPAQVGGITRVLSELANLRAARRAALDRDDVSSLATMVAGLRQIIGFAMLRELFDWARELALDPRLDGLPERPGVLATAAFAAWRQGDLVDAERMVEEGLEVAVEPLDIDALHDTRATVHLLSNRPEEAAHLWLKIDEGGTVAPEVKASSAAALGYAGRTDEALDLARQALDEAVDMEAPIVEAFCLYALGELLMGIDDEQAERMLRRAIELDPPDVAGFGGALAHITLVTLWQRLGDHDAALLGYRDLVARWWQSASWTQLWTTLRNLAPLLAEHGERTTALLILTNAAHAPAAPATSAAEGARLERIRSDLEAELGAVPTADGTAVAQEALAALDRLLAAR